MFNSQSHLSGPQDEGPQDDRQRFHCQECGKQYNTQLGFRRHLVAAHSTAGAPLCPQTPPSLLEQLGGHTDRPPPPEGAAVPVRERKYSCERCDRRFYTRKDVRRHAVVHTGRRDFLCPRCAQRFGRRDHLTRHLKKSHAQEPGLMTPPPAPVTPVATPTAVQVKEEPRPCELALPKEDPFCRDMYPSYSMPPHGLAQGPSGLSRPSQPPLPQPPLPQQPYSGASRYQHPSTSYPRSDVDSFLLDLQSAPPPHSSPQRDDSELSCTTNLLGFLPFGLPPYSAHMGMGGLMMNYPPSSSSSSSPSAGLPSQAPGPFFLQPQTQVNPGSASHNHNQLPQAYGGSGPSGALPHYYQAFQ